MPINQAVVADGKVFYSTNGYFTEGMHIGALSASNGDLLWQYPIVSSFSVNPPTYASGRLYVQRGKGTGDVPQLLCLDAATGKLDWAAEYAAQWERYMAPTVFGDTVWVDGGSNGGMYGFNTANGAQRFFISLQQYDSWTPTYADGAVYAWVNGDFKAVMPSSGSALWSRNYGAEHTAYSVKTVSAILDGRAFLIGNSGLRAIDLGKREQAWFVAGTFAGSPAVDHTTVYAITGAAVNSYDAATGAAIGSYTTSTSLFWQPVVTKDRVIASSPTNTYIFDRATRNLLQTLPVGGYLSYAAGRLYVSSPFVVGTPGKISTYAVKLAEVEATPTPAPATPTPAPLPTPTVTPAPTPEATPPPDEKSTPPPGYGGPLWLDAQAANGIAYFLFATPARIERFDLVQRTWLDSIALGDTATAFTVDADGIYVSFARSTSRYALDGTGKTHLLNSTGSVDTLLAYGDVLYLCQSGGQISSANKNTGQTLSAKSYSYGMSGLSIARGLNKIFGRSNSVSPSDILEIAVDSAGALGGQTDSPYHGSYPTATRTFVSPNEQRVADNAGIVYNTSDLSYAGSLAGDFDDLSFYGNLPVVLRGQTLIAYKNTYVESGRYSLSATPKKVVVQGDDAFVFHSADTRGVWVQRVPLALLSPDMPGPPVDPEGLAYTPDAVEYGDGVVYLLSRSNLSVFRWSVADQRYLATIPLTEPPTHMAYAPENGRLYLAYSSGRIGYFVDGAPGKEQGFANLPQACQGLAAAGEYLFACDLSGSWSTHYIFSPNGSLESQKDWNYVSSEYLWDAALRKVFFLRDDTSPNDLLWEDIDIEGKLGEQLDSPYHESTGFVHPIRIFPDGSKVLLGSGRIFSAVGLAIIDVLSNEISDAGWLGGRLLTLRANGSNAELQEWDDRYAVVAARSLAGSPLRLFAWDGGALIITITSSEDGPVFTKLNSALEVVDAPEPGSTPEPTPRPLPTATPTPVSTPVPTATPKATATPGPPRPQKDREKPILKISGGLNRITKSGTLVVSGYATDNDTVKAIRIKTERRAYRNIPSTDFFSTRCSLEKGRNVFWIRAIDASGNYTEVRLVITCRR